MAWVGSWPVSVTGFDWKKLFFNVDQYRFWNKTSVSSLLFVKIEICLYKLIIVLLLKTVNMIVWDLSKPMISGEKCVRSGYEPIKRYSLSDISIWAITSWYKAEVWSTYRRYRNSDIKNELDTKTCWSDRSAFTGISPQQHRLCRHVFEKMVLTMFFYLVLATHAISSNFEIKEISLRGNSYVFINSEKLSDR